MDQVKIGRFIAERRKSENLTQAQLAEKLNITDRAVSKWENGRSLPDPSIMPELCGILHITINDLFSGEVVSMDKYNEQMEKNLLELARQKEEADKRLLHIEIVLGIISTLIILAPAFAAAYLMEHFEIAEWKGVLIVFSGLIPGLFGLIYCTKIEQVAGYYECAKCGHRHIPSFRAVLFSPHMGRTRHMKCPKCGEKSWQKKVIGKEKDEKRK